MTHFLFFLVFAACISIAFAVFAEGESRSKLRHGVKVFFEFVGISFVLAWVFYFLPL